MKNFIQKMDRSTYMNVDSKDKNNFPRNNIIVHWENYCFDIPIQDIKIVYHSIE